MNTKTPVIVLGTIEVGINLEGDIAVEVRGNGLSDPQLNKLREAFDRASAAFVKAFADGYVPTGRFKAGRMDLAPELVQTADALGGPSTTDVS